MSLKAAQKVLSTSGENTSASTGQTHLAHQHWGALLKLLQPHQGQPWKSQHRFLLSQHRIF